MVDKLIFHAQQRVIDKFAVLVEIVFRVGLAASRYEFGADRQCLFLSDGCHIVHLQRMVVRLVVIERPSAGEVYRQRVCLVEECPVVRLVRFVAELVDGCDGACALFVEEALVVDACIHRFPQISLFHGVRIRESVAVDATAVGCCGMSVVAVFPAHDAEVGVHAAHGVDFIAGTETCHEEFLHVPTFLLIVDD